MNIPLLHSLTIAGGGSWGGGGTWTGKGQGSMVLFVFCVQF